MDLNVELVDIDTLISDPQNVRLHNERNRDAVQRSIKQFGIRKPIVAHAKTNAVRDILIENVAAIPEGTVAILLSGGIDSTAVALALRLAGKEPIAYTFTLDGHISTDFSCARYNARRLGIPFVPVFLPTDIEGTYQDIVTLIRDFGCASKASIECNWCFLHAVRQIKEAAIATGLGADLYFAVRRSERQHLSKNPVAFDRHRIRTFDDPAHGGISGLTCICESHGKRLYRPFYDRRLLALFVGKSWQALNRPRQKAPLWAAFAKELRGLKVKRHANLQAGDTNIREHFERVAAHVAPGVGMVKFYNTLRRDYGSERSDVTTGALGI